MATTSLTRNRRPKWQPTPPLPPTPKILHFPRRIRRKQPPPPPPKNSTYYFLGNRKGRLESLFGQEREFSRTDDDIPVVLLSNSDQQRRERVDDRESDYCGKENGFEEDKWKFQAEILRAECKFLRMEREFALKKLERNRKQLERALTCAVQTLISGRKKMCEGENENVEFEKEVEELAEKLKELHKSSRAKNVELRNCHNFDKQACRLQHQLEKLGGKAAFEKSFQESEESSSLSTNLSNDNLSEIKNSSKSTDVEVLRRKMEGISMVMLDRMEEEYGSMRSTTADSSASSSKRMDHPQLSSGSLTQKMCQEQVLLEENKCSGRCKTLVRKIMDQVRAETEQWSQMQEMLGQIRAEMEELQASRDLWEDRALQSEHEIPFLHSAVQEWKEKALNSEAKANALQTELSRLKEQLDGKLRIECGDDEQINLSSVSLGKHIKLENNNSTQLKATTQSDDNHQEKMADDSMTTVKNSVPVSLGKQLEQEKRLLQLRRKENLYTEKHRKDDGRRKVHACNNAISELKRTPFHDIGNSSPLRNQNPVCNNGISEFKRTPFRDIGNSSPLRNQNPVCNNGISEFKRTPFRDIGNSSPLRNQNPVCNNGISEFKRTPFRDIGNSSPLRNQNPATV